MSGSLVNSGEDTGRFDDEVGSSRSPLNLGGVSVVEDRDGLEKELEVGREVLCLPFR